MDDRDDSSWLKLQAYLLEQSSCPDEWDDFDPPDPLLMKTEYLTSEVLHFDDLVDETLIDPSYTHLDELMLYGEQLIDELGSTGLKTQAAEVKKCLDDLFLCVRLVTIRKNPLKHENQRLHIREIRDSFRTAMAAFNQYISSCRISIITSAEPRGPDVTPTVEDIYEGDRETSQDVVEMEPTQISLQYIDDLLISSADRSTPSVGTHPERPVNTSLDYSITAFNISSPSTIEDIEKRVDELSPVRLMYISEQIIGEYKSGRLGHDPYHTAVLANLTRAVINKLSEIGFPREGAELFETYCFLKDSTDRQPVLQSEPEQKCDVRTTDVDFQNLQPISTIY